MLATHERAASLRAHGFYKRLKGGGRAQQIDFQHAAQHRQVVGLGRIEATRHPGIGNDQVGRAPARHPVGCHGLHGGAVRHVGRVDGTPHWRQRGQGLKAGPVQPHQRHDSALA